MSVWILTVTHQDQTTATAAVELDAPGDGQSVTIPSKQYSCGHNHTLVGTQSDAFAMSGTGVNSVAPPNDPGSQGFPKGKDPGGDPEPSWQGSPATEEEEQSEGEDEGDGEDGAYGGNQPADGGER